MLSNIYVASVVSVKDIHSGGMIKVTNPSIQGGKPIVCYASSPTGGGGSGFFSVPGKHSNVLITQANINNGKSIWVWLSCVYLPTNNAVGVDGTPLDTDDIHVTRTDNTGLGNRVAGDNAPYFSHDNPDHVDIYQDNFLPEGEVWKSRGGHSFSMFTKNTSERNMDGITVRSAAGKVLLFDDSNKNSVGCHTPREFKSLVDSSKKETSKGDRVVLMHESENRVVLTGEDSEIVSNGTCRLRAKKKIDISVESPTSREDIDIVNNGTGDINIESNSSITIRTDVGTVQIDSKIAPIPTTVVIGTVLTLNPGILIGGKPVVTYG